MPNNAKPIHITWIAGMPRSGTTWLSQVFASAQSVRLKFCPLFSYEFKNALDERSTSKQWQQLFNNVYNTQSEYLDQDYLRHQGLIPTFKKLGKTPAHLVIKSTRFHNLVPRILALHSTIKFIHIVRHPCATIYSWLSNPHEFPDNVDIGAQWRSGRCRKVGPGEFWGFNDWKKVNQQALNLARQYPDRFLLIQYESLLKSPYEKVRQLFDFCGVEYAQQTEDFIRESQSKHDAHKRSVYKRPTTAESWRTELAPNIINSIIDELRGSELEQFTRTE